MVLLLNFITPSLLSYLDAGKVTSITSFIFRCLNTKNTKKFSSHLYPIPLCQINFGGFFPCELRPRECLVSFQVPWKGKYLETLAELTPNLYNEY